MSRYAKAIAAFLGTIATWGATAYSDNLVDRAELFGLLAAVAAVFAVYQIPNTPPAGEASDPNISEQDI